MNVTRVFLPSVTLSAALPITAAYVAPLSAQGGGPSVPMPIPKIPAALVVPRQPTYGGEGCAIP
jgi:hypothetical protein